jgi:hypothetical protein
MKNILLAIASVAAFVVPLGIATTAFAAAPAWNTTGTYVVDMHYLGTDNNHDMVLTQDALGNLTGHGGSPAGANTYTWVITSGTVSSSTIDFLANYTATADAVTPQTVLHVTGTIAPDGTISGTWSDNYQGGARSGALTTVSGNATPIASSTEALSAQDFGVVNYDTGLGILKGYSAGFGLTNATGTLAGAQSVVVQLFASTTLLQTNTAILPKFNTGITGTQFSSPFDVSGTFQYATDGYWTNVRQAQFGQSTGATRVVATVTLGDGTVVTAENDTLAGDPTTIFATSTTATTTPPVASTTASISGEVYNDLNNNGVKNAGEPGLSGWTINLYNHAGWSGPKNLPPMTSTVTDANGNYSFANLPDGVYSVEEINQKGWTQVTSDYFSLTIKNGVAITNSDFADVVAKNSQKGNGDGNQGDQGHDNNPPPPGYGSHQGNYPPIFSIPSHDGQGSYQDTSSQGEYGSHGSNGRGR